MRIGTLGYVGGQGIKSIGRNKMFTIACIATTSACIFMFGLFFALALNMQNFVRMAERTVAITVLFDEEINQAQIDHIGERLRIHEDVREVNYISADEAWERFKNDFFADSPELAGGFDNPLASSNSFEVFLQIPDYEEGFIFGNRSVAAIQRGLVEYAKSLNGVRLVNHSDAIVNVLSTINTLIGLASGALILILLGISMFLISNIVKIGIAVRKEEIAIMKYIGAKDFVVRSPFVIEGLILGLIGAAIPLIILFLLYDVVVLYLNTRFEILHNIVDFLPILLVYRYLLPIGVILGVGIGFFGSYLTVKKHLRV